MEANTLRKPKQYFDSDNNPSHVTFDDGKDLWRIIPWQHLVEVRWYYAELDAIKMEIGDWLVVIRGHNLEPLVLAIQNRTVVRIYVRPEMDQVHGDLDTFVTDIRFLSPPVGQLAKRGGQIEFDLGG